VTENRPTTRPDAQQPTARSAAQQDDATADVLDYGRLPELVGFELRRADMAVLSGFARLIAPLQVTPGQFGVLALIDANPGLSQSTLAKAVGIERSTMVAVIDRLESRGLVRRCPSAVDRRSYALMLSPEGKALAAQIAEVVREYEAGLLDGFTDRERATLIALLRRISGHGAP